MAAFIDDSVLDALLQLIEDDGNRFVICSAQPTNYAQANNNPGSSGYRLGYKDSITYTGPQDRTSPAGRELQVDAISSGAVDYSGTATHWAIIDTTGSVLLVTHSLSSSVAVSSGGTFDTAAFEIYVADPS